jgi:hypothetical protein
MHSIRLLPCLVENGLYALVRVSGVDDHCVLRLIVNNQVGVIIASTGPCILRLISLNTLGELEAPAIKVRAHT